MDKRIMDKRWTKGMNVRLKTELKTECCKCPCSRKVWCKFTGNLLEKPPLLLFDQFRSSVAEATKSLGVELNVCLAVIPGGLTSQLQTLYILSKKSHKLYIYMKHGPNG
jgi:hypothetical protein